MLITRPHPACLATAARVAAMGLEPVIAPMLRVETLPAELPAPDGVQALLATSGNALPALPPAWWAVPLLTVGDATAREARAVGFAAVRSADGDGRDLAGLAARLCRPDGPPLLLASGAGQGEALAAALSARGFAVLRREVYAARPASALPASAEAALALGRLRAGLFFSAETARAFVRLVLAAGLASRVEPLDAVTIGRPAGMALEPLPWRRIRVAARPTQDEMLALLR